MDKEIWQNIPEGDPVAYAQLYFNYFKKFYNYGKKFTGDISLIEDSIQEVFMEIWNKRKKIPEIDSPDSYFFSAFRFILLKKIRQLKRSSGTKQPHNETAFSIELQIITQETDSLLQQKLAAALKWLTPRQKEAIFLRFYEGLSYEEVAAILNISVKATYKIIARSITSLKDHICLILVSFLLLQLLPG